MPGHIHNCKVSQECCLYDVVHFHTRITTATATLIDSIFANSMFGISRCGIIINDATDHLPIFLLSSKYTSEKENDNYICSRKKMSYL